MPVRKKRLISYLCAKMTKSDQYCYIVNLFKDDNYFNHKLNGVLKKDYGNQLLKTKKKGSCKHKRFKIC
jgi:hypothetical protein